MAEKYVCRAISGNGWRIWNRHTKRWWGNFFKEYPEKLVKELNGLKRSEIIQELSKSSFSVKDP